MRETRDTKNQISKGTHTRVETCKACEDPEDQHKSPPIIPPEIGSCKNDTSGPGEGLVEAQYIKVAQPPIVLRHTDSRKGLISLKD
jgi:hypothetical protein